MVQSLARGSAWICRHDDGALHHVGIRLDEVLHHAEPIHARHHQIEDDGIEGLRSIQLLDRFLPVSGFHRVEASAAEDAKHERPDGRLVIGNENTNRRGVRHRLW